MPGVWPILVGHRDGWLADIIVLQYRLHPADPHHPIPDLFEPGRLELDSYHHGLRPDPRLREPTGLPYAPGSRSPRLSCNHVLILLPIPNPPPLFPEQMSLSNSPINSTLFENTINERTVYLGPWEIVGSEQRRVLWQCSYQMERLEQFRTLRSATSTFLYDIHSNF